MSYKNLGQYLTGYGLDVPSWLSPALGEYQPDQGLGTIADEITRRSNLEFGKNYGNLASMYSQAGRLGPMHQKMAGELIDTQGRGLEGSLAQLFQGDRQAWLDRMLQAMGIMGGLQQGAMSGVSSGYGADVAKQAQLGSANIYSQANKDIAAMQNALGYSRLGLDRQFGLMDRDYRQTMMPYDILGKYGGLATSILGNYGTQNTSGYAAPGTMLSPGAAFGQGFIGGGLGTANMLRDWFGKGG